ncbi:NHLP bacteriocin system secretion protein [Azonexus sp.]|uniref:NHLP bacteriocin system secretion protein n=1 Tax=Azonexus sp. TaxID=1872668 RepID=UPI0027BA6EF7|nr:NHLP bacteriocin system secretion protein [Azonexus sp.]
MSEKKLAARQIFRQAALDRLSSPEQLDRLLTLTDTRGWVALAICAGLLFCFLFWSIFGRLPTHVTGQGILMPRSGLVADASSQASGTLARFLVGTNDLVKKGQAVAVVNQTEAARRAENTEDAVRDQEKMLARFDRDYQHELRSKTDNLGRRRQALLKSISDGESRVAFLIRTLKRQEETVQKGFFSERALDDSRTEISRVRQEIADHRHELAQLNTELLEFRNQYERGRDDLVFKVNEARRLAGQQALILARDSIITAPNDGRVIELKLAPGAMVQAGQSVLSIENGEGELGALVYMPTEHGKKLVPGQEVRLAPANVKKEEYGTLRGRIESISEFPVSREGIISVLPNAALADMFFQKGPPYAVQISLEPDAGLSSGYRWTSAEGPPFPIVSGTTVNAEVTVEEQRPISLLIPFLRKTSGLYLH